MSYDLLIMQNITESGESSLVELSFGESTKAVEGIQKAVQKWMIAFFTKKGSVLARPTYGTNFLDLVGRGNAIANNIIQAQFDVAAADIANWEETFVDNSDEELPDDEIIESAVLTDFNLDGNVLQLHVTITTAAGETRTYKTPEIFI